MAKDPPPPRGARCVGAGGAGAGAGAALPASGAWVEPAYHTGGGVNTGPDAEAMARPRAWSPEVEAEGGEAAEAELLRGAPPGLLGQVWVFSRVLAEEELAGLHGTTRHQYALAAAAEAEAEAEGGDVPARGSVSLSL